jgi:hypothetical protein
MQKLKQGALAAINGYVADQTATISLFTFDQGPRYR